MKKLMTIDELAVYFHVSCKEIETYLQHFHIEPETMNHKNHALYLSEEVQKLPEFFGVYVAKESIHDTHVYTKDCLTISEASELYQVSYAKLQRLIKNEQIDPIYIGDKNKKYYAKAAFEKIIGIAAKSMQNTDIPEFCTGGITQSAPEKQTGSSVKSVQNTDMPE
ncbi:hypothetical protein BZK37_17715, partial [Enterococcus casseliflavus]